MKKTLALTLALLLALSLCVPALAAGEDAYAAYEAAHPEELAALDAQALLAGWGYEDFTLTAEEQFMAYREEATLEEAVKREYIENRLLVEEISGYAEEYRAEYPEEWAAFDPDRYFEEDYNEDGRYEDKADYMAYWNILTDEEFADDMFVFYTKRLDWEDEDHQENDLADDQDGWDFEDWTEDWTETDPAEETPGGTTLTLVVNGVETGMALEAEDWVTYLDAADARTLLGNAAAAPTAQGKVPLRQAAEAAGWDVVWYDGDPAGLAQQVCLWNEEVFRAELEAEFGPFQGFCDALLDAAQAELQSAVPRKAAQTATAELTTFSTLDGSQSCTFRARGEQIWQSGVVDGTVTLDLSALAGLLTDRELAALAQAGGMEVSALKSQLGAVKLETILDVNEGGAAFRAPALAFLDPDLWNWQTSYDPEGDFSARWDVAGTLYAEMLDRAGGAGGLAAREEMEQQAEVLAALVGADCFHQSGGSWSYTLTTDRANAALGKLLAADGGAAADLFRRCEVTCHLDSAGAVDVTLALRPDTAEVARLATAEAEGTEAALGSALLRGLLGPLDLEVKLGASRDASGSETSLTLHLNNRGTLKLTAGSTFGTSPTAPRQLADAEREAVYAPLGQD